MASHGSAPALSADGSGAAAAPSRGQVVVADARPLRGLARLVRGEVDNLSDRQ